MAGALAPAFDVTIIQCRKESGARRHLNADSKTRLYDHGASIPLVTVVIAFADFDLV